MKRRMKRYQDGGVVAVPKDPLAGAELSSTSTLSGWAAPYVTNVLGQGRALAEKAYEGFEGPLTAGESDLQKKAFSGLAGLTLPTGTQTSFTPGTFTADTASQYMNPYLQASLDPQLAAARRAAEVSRAEQASRLSRAGAYGGGRQAIMESELNRSLMDQLGKITGTGYATAYDKAMDQFNREQNLGLQSARQAQLYGLEGLDAISRGGATQRAIDQEGIAADIAQFREERDYPKEQVQFMRNLIGQGMLPISTTTKDYQEPSTLSNIFGTASGLLTIDTLLRRLFPGG